MKKIALLGLTSLFVLASCGSDDKSGDTNIVDPATGPTQPAVNGSLSPEEGKQQLENNAVELLNKVESFKNDSALEQIIELAEFLTADDNSSAKQLNGFDATAVNTITNAANAQKNIVSVSAIATDDETTLQEFNENKGEYTWDASSDDFEKTGESDDLIYNIAYNGKNAVFSITDFNTTQAAENTEVPTLLKANLSINGTAVMSVDHTAAIGAGKTIPNSINNTTSIGGFSFVTNYTNNDNSKITQSFNFKIGNEVITGYSYETNGSFSNAENEDATIIDVLDSATVSLTFLNATLFTTANDSNVSPEDDLTIDQQIALLNSNINSELIIGDKSIAKGEFYKDQEETIFFPVVAPSLPGEEPVFVEPQTITEDVINARFLFEDGTSADFDTYFDDSFTETKDKFESVIDTYTKLFENVDFGFGDDDEEIIIIEPTIEEQPFELPSEEQPVEEF